MDAVAVVAIAGVAPIEDKNAAVGSVAQINAAEPWVGREEHIRLMAADVAAAGTLEPLDVHPAAVEIQRQELARGRPRATGRPGRSSRRYARARRRARLSPGFCAPRINSLEWSQCQWSAC